MIIKKFGLKQLGVLTGLSVSYFNEIEKGKKYPKPEKIMILAEGLGVEYDDLIPISMAGWPARSNLGTVLFLISSRFIPFSAFGITFENVVEKVNQTCERCPLDNSQCSEQTAPPSIFFQEEKEELMNRTIKKPVADYGAKNLRI